MEKMMYLNQEASAAKRAGDLLGRMTLTEKVGQMSQRLYGFGVYERVGEEVVLTEEIKNEVKRYGGLGTLYGLYRADPWSGRTKENGLSGTWAVKGYNAVQKLVIENSRFGIPALLSTECPHGHQALDGYLLPVNLAMGATFHPNLVKKSYEVCGKQLKEMGVDFALISMLDVLRDPRWGRSEECFGEDPYLCSEMARAAVNGMQSQGVIAVVKHFAAQGEGTGGINASAARIGERELREIHLPPMAACCEEKAGGVMAAYNEIDGIPCHGNAWLLRKILREEMGFQGLVMSDGVAVDRLDQLTGDAAASGAMAVRAGVDIDLWNRSFAKLEEAVKSGLLTEEEIDQVVLRILTVKFERGLFEHPYLEEEKPLSNFSYETQTESLQLARESVVLLKNKEQLLPLKKGLIKSIAVIGPNADAIYNQLGDYTPPVDDGMTVLAGIKKFAKQQDIEVHFARGCGLASSEEEELKRAAKLAAYCDAVVLVLGGSSSRFEQKAFDRNGAALPEEHMTMDCGEGVDVDALELPPAQKRLSLLVCESNKRSITIVMGGRPYAVPEEADQASAFLMSFYPGPMGGEAIGELLFGKVTPSGRLPVSVPAKTGQIPVYYNYKVSYDAKAPLFAFGDGISYGTLQYENPVLTKECADGKALGTCQMRLTVTVSNESEWKTAAVPMLFVRHCQASVIPRIKELKAFDKVWLYPGEKKQISFVITKKMLSLWNAKMEYVPEPGMIELRLTDGGHEHFKGFIQLNISENMEIYVK